MYERILIPLDRSSISETGFPYVAEISAKFGSELHLVTVAEPNVEATDLSSLAYFARASSHITNLIGNYGVKDATKIHTKTLSGKPANEILRYADSIDANLVIMTSHGASGKGEWALGNIAAKILRATSRPILLVRAPVTEPAMPQTLLKKILVPLDGSELGEAAIPLITELAGKLGSEVILFHADEPQISWGIYEGFSGYRIPPPDPESRKTAVMAYLNKIAEPLKKKGLNVDCAVEFDFSARGITDYAKKMSVDLIAMSTHGRSGIGAWVFGSVTDKVLHTGDKPVLVVRPRK